MVDGGGDQDVTQRVEPWDGARDHFIDLYEEAHQAEIAVGAARVSGNEIPLFRGPFYAGENAYDGLARAAVDLAVEQLDADIPAVRDLARRTLSGEFISNNPHLPGVIAASLDPIEIKLKNELFPQINDIMVSAGAFGGPAQKLTEEAVLEDFVRQATGIAAKLNFENYSRERSAQHGIAQVYGQIHNMDAQRVKLFAGNADSVRALLQTDLNEELRLFEELLAEQWRGISERSQVLAGGGFSNSTTDKPAPNRVGQIFQGAIGGASMGASMAGAAGAVGMTAAMPWMLPLAVLGGLSGAL